MLISSTSRDAPRRRSKQASSSAPQKTRYLFGIIHDKASTVWHDLCHKVCAFGTASESRTMSILDGSNWQTLFDELCAATDTSEIANKAQAVETAMFFRCQAIGTGPENMEERRAIDRAAQELLRIRVEKLVLSGTRWGYFGEAARAGTSPPRTNGTLSNDRTVAPTGWRLLLGY